MSEFMYTEAIKSFQKQLEQNEKELNRKKDTFEHWKKDLEREMKPLQDRLSETGKEIYTHKNEIEKLNKLIKEAKEILNSIQEKDRPKVIAERIRIHMEEHVYVDFYNNNCKYVSYNCQGWDGYSERCDCGHHLVEWNEELIFKHNIFEASSHNG